MRNFGNTIKVITLVSAGILVINTLIMSSLFNINIFKPAKKTVPPADDLAYQLRQPSATAVLQETTDTAVEAEVDGDGAMPTAGIEVVLPEGAGDEENKQKEDEQIGNAEDKDPAGYYLTTEEINSLENLSLYDKLEAFSLASKISAAEADKIYDMSVDGVTYQEMQIIEGILKTHLTGEDMQKLKEILKKK